MLVRLARRVLPIAPGREREHFFTRVEGRTMATGLFLALVAVEFTDLIFAVDSIPAVLAVTQDPFIVFTSNIFAILGFGRCTSSWLAWFRSFVTLRWGWLWCWSSSG